MRLAVAGKGGVGKTTISATMARLAARRGTPVVAVDADSNPNLAAALGVTGDGRDLSGLAPGLVSRRLDGPRLREPLDDVLTAHGYRCPDGVNLVAMGAPGHAEEGCLCSAHAAVSALLADLGDRPEVFVVIDLEASPEHLSRGTARHADVLVLVAEPYYRALEAVRRMAVLAAELPIERVAVLTNKVRSRDDAEAVLQFCERHRLAHIGEIPWSDDVMVADRHGTALLDHAPGSTAVRALAEVLDAMTSGVR